MIDRATVDRILDAVRIEEVVGDYVSLRRRGVNLVGNCPFHDEKTPSFHVSPAKGICKCFGCGKGGNSVNFIMEAEQLSYVEALKVLAKKYGIEVKEKELTPEELTQQNERESLLIVSEWAAGYFNRMLTHSDEGKAIAMSYFLERGFNESIIEKFQLGYCLDQKDGMTRAAIAAGYKEEFLIKTGLTIAGDGYKNDRFRGRVMFPIHSLSGKPIAFGGRVLKTSDKTAKYLNSPESELYHKSKIVYGIYHARKDIVKHDRCFLVEGYTDVLSMHQAGIENVVASSGTALTTDQIRLIRRFTTNITVLYDGDFAGIKASLRGIDLILEEGMDVRVLLLPDGEDPDSFAKKNSATALRAYITDNETDFIRFKAQLLADESKNDPIGRARLISDVVKSISLIPDEIKRTVFLKESSRIFEIGEQVLYSEMSKIQQKRAAEIPMQRPVQSQNISANAGSPTMVEPPRDIVRPVPLEEIEVLKYLIRYGGLPLYGPEDLPEGQENPNVDVVIVGSLDEDDMKFTNGLAQQIYEEYKLQMVNEGFEPEKYFLRHENPAVCMFVAGLFADDKKLSRSKVNDEVRNVPRHLFKIVPKVIFELKDQYVKTMQKAILDELTGCTDEDEQMRLLGELQQLNAIKTQLSARLGGRTITR